MGGGGGRGVGISLALDSNLFDKYYMHVQRLPNKISNMIEEADPIIMGQLDNFI